MKKIVFLAIFLCCFFIPYSQNTSDKEIRIYSIDNNEDIAKVFLELEKEINPILNVQKYLNKIDSLVEIITCEFENCMTIQDTLNVVNQQLFQKQQLSFQEDCEFISNIFDKQCGNCASFSAYYISVANRLGIKNLYPVLAPNHVFLRYDYNGTKINIETTHKGENYSNKWYRTYFGVSDKILLNDTYFRNLTKSEFIAVLINNRGNVFMKNENPEKAIEDFNMALSVFPSLAETYFGFAHYYDELGDKQKAIKQYDKVIQYNPDFANAYCNRGLLYEETGVFDSAISNYNNAIKLKPNFAEVYYNRGCAKILSKEYTEAIQDFTTTIDLGHVTANTYIYRGDCRNAISDKQGACEDWKMGFNLGYKSDNKKRILKYCEK